MPGLWQPIVYKEIIMYRGPTLACCLFAALLALTGVSPPVDAAYSPTRQHAGPSGHGGDRHGAGPSRSRSSRHATRAQAVGQRLSPEQHNANSRLAADRARRANMAAANKDKRKAGNFTALVRSLPARGQQPAGNTQRTRRTGDGRHVTFLLVPGQ